MLGPFQGVGSAIDAGFIGRHAGLAGGYGGNGDPVDHAQVQAMQIVLHIPKAHPPRRSALLAAVAGAAVALCLDERVGPGGVWEERYLAWKQSRIRKVARRARGAHWLAANEVDGLTLEIDGAQARALVPGPVGAVDPRIKRLQIGGTDLPHDDPGVPDAASAVSQAAVSGADTGVDTDFPVLWVNWELGMTLGKAAAQVGHASMLLAGALPAERAYLWARCGYRCQVRDADADRWRSLGRRVADGTAVAVRDAGFTEVAPGSTTVIAVPDSRATSSR